jgi:hypothetical protein
MPKPRQGQKQHTLYRKEAMKEEFIAIFRETANVKLAAAKVGIDRKTVYRWRQEDPDFAAKWAEAEEDANDTLRAEIYRRAVSGWDEPVVSAGKLVTHVHKYSDTLLIFLAKARMPEFRDKVDVNGNLAVGAYKVIEQASSDPGTTALANELLTRLALPSPSTGDDTSGPGVARDATHG